ncbi:hypothetical protein AVEN_64285-1 [Araneus ventricosus]|uniref:Uncharacterized protein n=1 Tax=Araneus ventricosus TaxID=182803 RepID=A0A4Y2MZH6_ARAVE|nr:hypothetical protein AVEN_64285-1 [Araneus ventricosus]
MSLTCCLWTRVDGVKPLGWCQKGWEASPVLGCFYGLSENEIVLLKLSPNLHGCRRWARDASRSLFRSTGDCRNFFHAVLFWRVDFLQRGDQKIAERNEKRN